MAEAASKSWEQLSNSEWIEMILENKRKKKKHDEPRYVFIYLPPDFEAKVDQKFPACKKFLFVQKILTATDVNPQQARLSIPCNELETFTFLKDEEIAHMRQGNSFEVCVIHKSINGGFKEAKMNFSGRHAHKESQVAERVSSSYVFTKSWNTLVLEDNLKEGDTIQCWAFRDEQNELMGMALVKVDLFADNKMYWGLSHHHGFDDPLDVNK